MKKFTKIILIVASVLAGVGVVCVVISFVAGGGRFTARDMAKAGTLDWGDWHFREDGVYYDDDRYDDYDDRYDDYDDRYDDYDDRYDDHDDRYDDDRYDDDHDDYDDRYDDDHDDYDDYYDDDYYEDGRHGGSAPGNGTGAGSGSASGNGANGSASGSGTGNGTNGSASGNGAGSATESGAGSGTAQNGTASGSERAFATSDVQRVEVDVARGKLTVREDASASDIKVTLDGGDAQYLRTDLRNGTLSVGYGQAGGSQDSNFSIDVAVPSGASLTEIDLETGSAEASVSLAGVSLNRFALDVGAGSAVLDGCTSTGRAELDVGSGTLSAKGASFGGVDLSCETGTLEFDGASQGAIEADCESGSMRVALSGAQEDYNYRLEYGTGSIKVGDRSWGGAAGRDSVTNGGAKWNADLECERGEMSISFQ